MLITHVYKDFSCIATSAHEHIEMSYKDVWAPVMRRNAAADAESANGLLCGNRSMDSMGKLARFLLQGCRRGLLGPRVYIYRYRVFRTLLYPRFACWLPIPILAISNDKPACQGRDRQEQTWLICCRNTQINLMNLKAPARL